MMSLPVSQYEALLEEVRGLRREAQQVQRLATPLLTGATSGMSALQQEFGDLNKARPVLLILE